MNRADVIEFIELHAQAATAEKRMKELRPSLLGALRGGEESPADLPFRLVMVSQIRTVKDYLPPLRRLLNRLYGKARADERLAQIEADFECIEVPSLNVKRNDAYAARLGEKGALVPEMETFIAGRATAAVGAAHDEK